MHGVECVAGAHEHRSTAVSTQLSDYGVGREQAAMGSRPVASAQSSDSASGTAAVGGLTPQEEANIDGLLAELFADKPESYDDGDAARATHVVADSGDGRYCLLP